jgi:hypothetical protein
LDGKPIGSVHYKDLDALDGSLVAIWFAGKSTCCLFAFIQGERERTHLKLVRAYSFANLLLHSFY